MEKKDTNTTKRQHCPPWLSQRQCRKLQAASNILSTVKLGHVALSHAGRNNLDNNDYSFAGRLPSAT